MGFTTPKNWEKESEDLFIHKSGFRVQRRTYMAKEGWFLISPDLDTPPAQFPMTPEGRDQAFEAFTKAPKKKATVVKPKKVVKAANAAKRVTEDESGEKPVDPDADPADAAEKDEDAEAEEADDEDVEV